MHHKTLLTIMLLGLALIAMPASVMAATPPSLVGSWQFTLTPTTPTPPTIAIPALATFTSDGTMIETDGSELAPKPAPSSGATPTYSSPGHGIWQLGPSMTFFYVQYYSIVANQNGTLNSSADTTMTVTLDSTGTIFSGNFVTSYLSPSGKVIRTVSGMASGTQIPHPLLP